MTRRWVRNLFRNTRDTNRRKASPARLFVLPLEDRVTPSSDPLSQIDHFVVIYQENWSFDSLYGLFPGATGFADASASSQNQLDRLTGHPYTSQLGQPFDLAYNGPALTTPPQPINNGAIDTRFPSTLNTLHHYNAGKFLSPGDKTGDLVHRYFQEQSQINHGAQNQYLTWSDNPGLALSWFDATNLPEGLLAQQYTLDDNFFHAAFGGSFLNHQFLVAAAAPVYANAPSAILPQLDATGNLKLDPVTGKIVRDGKVTPIGGASFADPGQTFDKNYAINTIFSANLAPDFLNTNVSPNNLLPSQNDSNPNGANYIQTIGDQLDTAGVSWKWFSGGWDNALAGSPSNPANNGKTPANDPADPLFQWHHQPFAYYNNFAPWLPNGQRNPLSAAHLQDEVNFFADLSSGNLPAVSFIKPLGPDNEHPGYAGLLQGQQHVADIVHALQNSADWAHTAIIITYDENGGRWDHVSPPNANGIWGDGTRVPAIVISPYAKRGFVDHTQHDTLSILSTIESRFGLQPLNQFDANASTLASSFQSEANASIGMAYLQPDATNVGKFALIVGGTEGNDHIHVSYDAGTNTVSVTIDSQDGSFSNSFDATNISRLEIYSQGGNDHISIDSNVTLPAFVFGGDGNNHIEAGGGSTVVVGGSGNDHIDGGSGASIIIGGAGEDHLVAGSGSTLLIGGTTDFDANRAALQALLNEWSRTDETYLQRVAHITGASTGVNDGTTLSATTVHDDGSSDILDGGGSGMDLFFAHLTGSHKDKIFNQDPGEVIIEI